MRFFVPLLVVVAALNLCGCSGEEATPQGLGRIEFPNSGAAESQADFLEGVLLLHSFEYEDAREAFQRARKIDPGFALAAWGEALTHYHPVWNREEPEQGRDALTDAPDASTDREAAYLAAARVLFGDGEREQRWADYASVMEEVAERYPEDLEARTFWAVSLFGTTGGERDFRTYMRVGSIVEEVFMTNREHPGALHYLIHAYDDPVHAALGLRAARRYAAVAPSAAHALHMPSHVFFALGMWHESIASNIDSFQAAEDRVARKGLGAESRGYHALWWLEYALLQQGRFAEAREKLDIAAADASANNSARIRLHYSTMRSHYLIETEDWNAELPRVAVEDLEDRARGTAIFTDGLAALRSGDLAGAKAALEAIPAVESGPRIDALELEGLILIEEGQAEQGLEKLALAAALEDRTPLDFGPPDPIKPAHELLGEVLLTMGFPERAAEQFRAALERAPGRRLSLDGLKRASAER